MRTGGLDAWAMARLMGWHLMRKTVEACDDCGRPSSNTEPVWLVSLKPEKSNDVRCLCGGCLQKRLEAHMRAQASADALVEEHQHAEAAV